MGFSEAEAKTYIAILRSGPQSAYAAARLVGQAPSNMYRVIEGLIRKGALVSDGGSSAVVRAVPIEDVLAKMRAAFEHRTHTIERELGDVETNAPDPGTYRLEHADQVLTRARNMISAASSVALIDAFPLALEAVSGQVEAAGKRGVQVLVKCYDDRRLRAARVVRAPGAAFARDEWPGEWLNVVTDGREALIAYLDPTLSEVHQAVWTRSKYLAWALHGALAAEMSLAEIASQGAARPDAAISTVLRNVRKNLFSGNDAMADVAQGIF